MPLVILLGPGQAGDSPMFENLFEAVQVRQAGSGQTQTGPVRGMADKAYSSKANRAYLRDRGIQCVIPEKEDQKANRKRKGSTGGRPVSYDKEAYKRRNVVERSFTPSSNGVPWPPATTNSQASTEQPPSSKPS